MTHVPTQQRLRSRSPAGLGAAIFADQALNSGSNIVLVILVAGSAPVREFSLFATGQLIVVLGQTIGLAALGDPLLQTDAGGRCKVFRGGLSLVWWALLLGIPATALGIVFGLPAALGAALVAVPAICGVDYVRTYLLAERRVFAALGVDAVFALAQLGGMSGWALAGGWHGAVGAWLIWGGSALVVLTPFALGAAYRKGRFAGHVADRAAVNLRYGAEMGAFAGSAQIAQLAAASRIGLEFNGTFRAVLIPFGPLSAILQAARPLLIPMFVRRPGRRGRSLLLVVCAAYGALCVVATVTTWTVLRSSAARVLGNVHPSAAFVLLVGFNCLSAGVQMLVFYYFRARHRDYAVSVSRLTVIAVLAIGVAVSMITRSGSAFLLSNSASMLGGTVAMLLTGRRTPGSRHRGLRTVLAVQARDAVAR